MGAPIPPPNNVVLDPNFNLPDTDPANPWTWVQDWAMIGSKAVFDQQAAPPRFGLAQAGIIYTPGNEYTLEFEVSEVLTSTVPPDGFWMTFGVFQSTEVFLTGHYWYHFTAAGIANLLTVRPPTTDDDHGHLTIDNIYLYEQTLANFVATAYGFIPVDNSRTETWDLGAGKFMAILHNPLGGSNILLKYEP